MHGRRWSYHYSSDSLIRSRIICKTMSTKLQTISNKTLHLLIIPTFRPTTDNLAQLEHILLSQGQARVGFWSSRSEKWKRKAFTLFREVQSEKKCFHSFSRSAKWKTNAFTLFREVKSEIKMLRDRDREVKILENSEQFSRNEIFEQVETSLWGNLAPNKVEELTIVNENEEKATCFKQHVQTTSSIYEQRSILRTTINLYKHLPYHGY